MDRTLFVLGATGFIGRQVVAEAVATDWPMRALTCSDAGTQALRQAGAGPVPGDARQPDGWIVLARGAAALVDLLQPPLPRRLTRAAVQRISAERQALTRGLVAALQGLPAGERPLFASVSGADDLQPDARSTISHCSPLRTRPRGFAHIGLPVRQLVDASGLDAVHVYFGNLVYGPGKVFAEQYVKGLAGGKARVIGSGANRLPLTHVTDAARALVHVAGLPRGDIVGRSFVAMDGADTTQRELLDLTADAMGVKRPGSVPAWIARLVAGTIAVETITLDAHADPSALLATGFRFRYPSYREGVPATLAHLGKGATTATPGAVH
jgi:nucleoside-diphosphate-sugar epimerase